MKLTALPILAQPTPRYQGKDTAGYLDTVLSDFHRLTNLGLRPEELPEDLFEGFVFWQFITGVTGQYTVNGSAFARHWRWIEQAQKMAAKLDERDLADQLAQAWQTLKAYPDSLLDEYDACTLVPDGDPEMAKTITERFPDRTVIAQSEMDALFDLLDGRWDSLVKSAHGHPGGDGYTPLENALARYLDGALPLEILESQAAYDARLSQVVDGLDDYPTRIQDSDIISYVRDLMLQVGQRFLHWGYYGIPTPDRPLNTSQLITTRQRWLVAAYYDRAQLIDFETWEEAAHCPMPPAFTAQPKRDGLWTYDDYPDWHLDDKRQIVVTKRSFWRASALRGPVRRRDKTQ